MLNPAPRSAQPTALDAIATALSDSTVFGFDLFFKLHAILVT